MSKSRAKRFGSKLAPPRPPKSIKNDQINQKWHPQAPKWRKKDPRKDKINQKTAQGKQTYRKKQPPTKRQNDATHRQNFPKARRNARSRFK